MDMDSGGWWLIAAAGLALAELALPGIYLAFFAIAAAITGALALLFPQLGLVGELIAFSAWSVVAVVVGRRWYRDYPVATSDPLLNDRAARLVGSSAVVVDAIESGEGRVRIGDGEWPASGPDLAAGARVTITAVESGVVRVEPVGDAGPRPLPGA